MYFFTISFLLFVPCSVYVSWQRALQRPFCEHSKKLNCLGAGYTEYPLVVLAAESEWEGKTRKKKQWTCRDYVNAPKSDAPDSVSLFLHNFKLVWCFFFIFLEFSLLVFVVSSLSLFFLCVLRTNNLPKKYSERTRIDSLCLLLHTSYLLKV